MRTVFKRVTAMLLILLMFCISPLNSAAPVSHAEGDVASEDAESTDDVAGVGGSEEESSGDADAENSADVSSGFEDASQDADSGSDAGASDGQDVSDGGSDNADEQNADGEDTSGDEEKSKDNDKADKEKTDDADDNGVYISEVRIGMGETEAEAKKELEADGFTILKDDSGNNADLNVDAGTSSAAKEGANDKIVYLGYKTTTDASDAITDLAVMNMNGGYSIEDYNILMEQEMNSQIKPFVDNFIATLEEYRANYKKPDSSFNHIRADYMRRLLNKLTDDDTGGQPLGDLLLGKTKYELGDTAYDKLSDAEKKNYCDILTLLMQANGQATLTLKKLVTRASDTSDDTWLDRFQDITLDDLVDEVEKEDSSL
ncbi:MAG: hypothetical protein IJM01_01675, partial [Eubacterium sp.]|nr:hypothetical protein [Eubacterium sp.]